MIWYDNKDVITDKQIKNQFNFECAVVSIGIIIIVLSGVLNQWIIALVSLLFIIDSMIGISRLKTYSQLKLMLKIKDKGD